VITKAKTAASFFSMQRKTPPSQSLVNLLSAPGAGMANVTRRRPANTKKPGHCSPGQEF
jgi:hypothetical protein